MHSCCSSTERATDLQPLTPRAPRVSQAMQRAPKVGATVYAWEDDVSSFDLAEWQVKVFQPIDVALRDVSSAYGKRRTEGKKTCVLEAPDGSTWWVTQTGNGKPGEIHCTSTTPSRFFSLGGVAKYMASADGAAFIACGVCIYVVTDTLDDKGALPVTSAAGEPFTLKPGSWYRTAQRAETGAAAAEEDEEENEGEVAEAAAAEAAPDTDTLVGDPGVGDCIQPLRFELPRWSTPTFAAARRRMEAILAEEAADVTIPAIGKQPLSIWQAEKMQSGDFKFSNAATKESEKGVARFKAKWNKTQTEMVMEVLNVDREARRFTARCCSEGFEEVEVNFKLDDHDSRWRRVSGPAEPAAVAGPMAEPPAEPAAVANKEAHKRTRAPPPAAEPAAAPAPAKPATPTARPAARPPRPPPSPAASASTETAEEVVLTTEQQLRQLRSRVLRAHDRQAAEQLAALYTSLDDTATDEQYDKALAHHQAKVEAERAKLPLTAIDESIATLQEKRAAVQAAQAALQAAETEAAAAIKTAEAHVAATRSKRPAEAAGEAGGPDGKRGRK